MSETQKTKGPELIFAFVGAIGNNRELICRGLLNALSKVNYKAEQVIRLTDLFGAIQQEPFLSLCTYQDEYERYRNYIQAGDYLRECLAKPPGGGGDATMDAAKLEKIGAAALALGAIGQVQEQRENATGNMKEPCARRAYVLWSLKHPQEVETLREIYGPRLFVIGAYSRKDNRREYLQKKIAESLHDTHDERYEDKASTLLMLDENEEDKKFGQKVRDTFPLCDVFIDVSTPSRLEGTFSRFVELVFGNTSHTPTRDEHAMFHARGAALRSGSLSRQVGSVITSQDGDIIAVGTNEVPKAGGGLCWPGDTQGKRDFDLAMEDHRRQAMSDKMIRQGVEDIFQRLIKAEWLTAERTERGAEELAKEALYSEGNFVAGAQFVNLIEYGRAVHAEMAAIIDAARRGAPVQDGVLYTTTFPCHDCARHIVAAGIQRVVYIEPYAKSYAPKFHADSIVVEGPPETSKVTFEPFVGVAPRQYLSLFSMLRRKDKCGNVLRWEDTRSSALPRGVDPREREYINWEEARHWEFQDEMRKRGLKTKPG